MAQTPVEVAPLYGTDGNDILFLTQAALNAGDFNLIWTLGYGGNDAIVRDRTGGYTAWNGEFSSGELDGGSGFDVASYAGSAFALSANLTQGFAGSDTPKHWANGLGMDFFESIEGLVGTMHDDHVVGGDERNKLWGHDGDDEVWGEDGNDDVWGGQGDDLIYGGAGADKLHGEAGEDRLRGGDAADLLYGAADDDDLRGDDGNDTLHGDAGHDTLRGGEDADALHGGADDDTLHGDGGDDALHVGAGDDVASGGSGDDRLHVSGAGDNDLYGGSGADWVQYAGGSGVLVNLWSDLAIRTDGSDAFDGVENVQTASGDDTVFGTSGHNRIWTGSGDDAVYTMGGDDEVRAGSGDDVVSGYGGDETIYGEGGNDHLHGEGGDEAISGGSGRDFIEGGNGSEDLWGGADADTFHFAAGEDGGDTLKDFDASEDMLSFGANFFTGQNLPGFDISDALWADPWFDGGATLIADKAGVGLIQFARFDGVSAATINQKIANGAIFDVETSSVGDDAPDGLAPEAPISVLDLGWNMLA